MRKVSFQSGICWLKVVGSYEREVLVGSDTQCQDCAVVRSEDEPDVKESLFHYKVEQCYCRTTLKNMSYRLESHNVLRN